MSYTLTLGAYSKRLNSTAQPVPDSTWASYTVTLKEETPIDDPVLLLSASFSTVCGYNYGVFQGRYYWITDVVAVRTNVVEVHMSLDYMATYKAAIQATRAFVEYGFNTAASTLLIDDSRIPTSLKPYQYDSNVDPFDGLIDKYGGTYIVQAVGNDPRTPSLNYHKGLAAFALDFFQLNDLMASVSPSIATDINTILSGSLTPAETLNQLTGYSMQQSLLTDSAFGAIQSVNWVPLSLSKVSNLSTQRIYLGNYNSGVDGILLLDHTPLTADASLTIPWPWTTDAYAWRNSRCQILLYLPFFGTVPIPTDKVIGISTIEIHSAVVYASGSLSIRVTAGSHTLFTGSTNIATSYGVGRSTVLTTDSLSGSIQEMGGLLRVGSGVLDIGASVVGAALGVGSGGVSGAIGGITGGLIDQVKGAAQQIQPTISCVGALGGSSAIGQSLKAEISLLYYDAYDDANFQGLYGHPVMRIDTPASGYCKTAGFSIALPGHAKYAALINATMDGGAFIE